MVNYCKIYTNFVDHLLDICKEFDLTPMLPEIKIKGIITSNETAKLQSSPDNVTLFSSLFLSYMPAKNPKLHLELIKVFESNGYGDSLGSFLRTEISKAQNSVDHTTLQSSQLHQATSAQIPKENTMVHSRTATSEFSSSEKLLFECHSYGLELEALQRLIKTTNIDESPDIATNFNGRRSLALLIDNYNHGNNENQTNENVNCNGVHTLLKNLDCDVLPTRQNRKAKEMVSDIREFAQLFDHTRHDSCIIFVTTYGLSGNCIGIDNVLVQQGKLIDALNENERLNDIPKIFIFQNCHIRLSM